MSIRFSNEATVVADYGSTQQLPSAYPVTVTAWLYVAATSQPGVGKVWPIWAFGAPGGDEYLSLEAEPGTAGTLKLVAAFKGTTRTETSLDGVTRGEWHCVSVTLGDQVATAQIKLYADGDTATPSSGSKAGFDPTSWNRFVLGGALRQDTTDLEAPMFDAEHVAIWQEAIGDPGGGADNENTKMFLGKIPPRDVKPGEFPSLGGPPDFSYWYITAHSRGGLRVNNDQKSDTGGELGNQVPTLPVLQNESGPGIARWASNTPMMRYTTEQAIDPSPPRRVHEPSRLQPMFFALNGPRNSDQDRLARGVPADVLRVQAPYTDPNIWQICYCDYLSGNDVPPPYLGLTADNFPTRDLSLVAKRCADYFEMQNLVAGTGVGPGGRYAGCIQVRGPGLGGLVGKPLMLRGYDAGSFRGIPGIANGIPLELNIGDWLYTGPSDTTEQPWSCWYREAGVRLLSEYMDLFWEALKQELDDRDLCYPLRLHMDYEDWPRENEQLKFIGEASQGEEADAQVGTWPEIVTDPRRLTEDLVFEYDGTGTPVAKTLDDLSPPAYNNDEDFYDQSQAFIDWWWKYSFLTRTQACADGVIVGMNDFFPYTTWGNYYNFTADNSDYPYAVNDQRLYVTPPDAVFPAGYSTPVVFSDPAYAARARGSQDGRIGYTFPESVRDLAKSRIDACVNSRQRFPLVPVYENALRYMSRVVDGDEDWHFLIAPEDMRDVYKYGWRRGANEAVLFAFRQFPPGGDSLQQFGDDDSRADPALESYRATMEVAAWLRDSVHSCAQYDQGRTGRTARAGQRSM